MKSIFKIDSKIVLAVLKRFRGHKTNLSLSFPYYCMRITTLVAQKNIVDKSSVLPALRGCTAVRQFTAVYLENLFSKNSRAACDIL